MDRLLKPTPPRKADQDLACSRRQFATSRPLLVVFHPSWWSGSSTQLKFIYKAHESLELPPLIYGWAVSVSCIWITGWICWDDAKFMLSYFAHPHSLIISHRQKSDLPSDQRHHGRNQRSRELLCRRTHSANDGRGSSQSCKDRNIPPEASDSLALGYAVLIISLFLSCRRVLR